MAFSRMGDDGVSVFEQRQQQDHRDDQPEHVGIDKHRHKRADSDHQQRIGPERITEEFGDPVPERHNFGCRAKIAHLLAAMGA